MNISKLMKPLEKLMKPLKPFVKLIPVILEAIIFMLITIPKFFMSLTNKITKFGKKALPVSLAISITFILIFFGLQMITTKITGTAGLIPHLPLALLTLFIIINIVEDKIIILRTIQKYLLIIFLFIFTNPAIKILVGFDVDIDEDDPMKSTLKIIEWIYKNIVKVILTFIILAYLIKTSSVMLWSYITFYSNNN